MPVHPLAIVSLSSSVLAYASAFVGSPALVWPGLLVAAVAIVTGLVARRAIAAVTPPRQGGATLALAGILSGAAFVVLAIALALMMRNAGAP